MFVQQARLDRIVVHRGPISARSRRAARTAMGTVVRSSLIGLGVGVSLTPDHSGGVLGLTTVGILAIGAALASWNA
jgi:hypothetical protein